MKRNLIFLALAGAALASCSSDEQVAVGTAPASGDIAFSTVQPGATRGSATDINTLKGASDGFKATCLLTTGGTTTEYFSGESYAWDAGRHLFVWKGTNTTNHKKYDKTGTHDFYAWYPTSITPTIGTSGDKTLGDIEPGITVAQQQDYIMAHTPNITAATDEATGTSLTFQHVMSMIKVMAKSDNSEYTFKVYGVRLGGLAKKGKYYLPTSSTANNFNVAAPGTGYRAGWDVYGLSNRVNDSICNYQTQLDNAVSLTSTAASIDGGNYFIVLPQQLVKWVKPASGDAYPKSSTTNCGTSVNMSYMAVQIEVYKNNVKVTDLPGMTTANNNRVWACVPIDTKFEPGKCYTFTLDFTNGAGITPPETEDPDDPGEPILDDYIRFTCTVTGWTDTPVSVTMPKAE